ncbi:hypothetical protein HMPREF3026_00845 [Lactobacillus sp. HMSC073D04]|nr:hypothetical protein HMPREF2667_01580 [Lactobacillus sp. HMSC064F12]OFO61101.1 hypothetical protein HMPREF3026_00845 [Lactobacillus sp. HMSC073D04]
MAREITRDDLNQVSMQVILHAGNARELTMAALTELTAEKPDFRKIADNFKHAHLELTEAHSHQTDMIQLEANGDFIPYSTLFGHAQDTLMTIQSEMLLAEKITEIEKKHGDDSNA